MNRYLLILLLLTAWPAAASQVVVECTHVATDTNKTRLVFATTAPLTHRIFTLDRPDRVIIDLPAATLIGTLPAAKAADATLVGLRSGTHNQNDLRIVLDLKQAVRVKSFINAPSSGDAHQLIIDLLPKATNGAPRTVAQMPSSLNPRTGKARPFIIAIDAGHGGEDPGAIGPGGTREKDVTLAIARKLAQQVDRTSGMRALMIRNDDTFISLRDRVGIARQHNADLFISIHADAFSNPEAHGSSVYTLSYGGASSEAATWLANRENNADRIGGIDLATNDDLLATVLLDMAQKATIEQSTDAAKSLLGYLGKIGPMHKSDVQHANFAVLKAPDIPSVLVEAAFISNADEERRLMSNAHQQRLAQAILTGVRAYFKKHPTPSMLSSMQRQDRQRVPYQPVTSRHLSAASTAPAGRIQTSRVTAPRAYVISPGDTLSGIASRHRVSVNALRTENGLQDSDIIRAGETLSIPADS